jgi:hypothetical protein
MQKLKICLNNPLKTTAWGGSAPFINNLTNFLTKKGHTVVFKLEKNIDLIIIISNMKYEYKSKIVPFLKYKKKNPNAKILHRINDCDKRKNTREVDKIIFKINKKSDKTVFISEWLVEYFIEKGFINPYDVIYNGCNTDFFYPEENREIGNVVNLVTHHWSNNWLKGFDIYIELDKILNDNTDISFTYIGRYNETYSPINTKLIPPLSGGELGDELRKYDIYLTASRWEPCGMHHVEGASCGLPVLYHKEGGGINESCKNYGLEYEDIPTLLEGIYKIKDSYNEFRSKIMYEFLSSERCSNDFYNIIEEMYK